MAKPTRRRLTMADLAILTAGAALAFLFVRISWETQEAQFTSNVVHSAGYRFNLWIAPFSVALALSLLAARMVPPRPRWRAVFRQPGTSACLAILAHLLAIVLAFTWHLTLASRFNGTPFRPNFNTYLDANRNCGAWVLVAWATLALARAWRPEPSWLDRSGRILGSVAILHWLWVLVAW
jgi:hypothetical protein